MGWIEMSEKLARAAAVLEELEKLCNRDGAGAARESCRELAEACREASALIGGAGAEIVELVERPAAHTAVDEEETVE